MLNRDVCARRKAPSQAKLRHSLLRWQAAGLDDEVGGRQSVDERGGDGLNSPCAFFFSKSEPQVRGALCFFLDGGEGEPTERE